MTTFRPGDVVLVHFPFTDLSSTNKRPALVLSPAAYAAKHGDVVVLALTSQPQPDSSLLLRNWRNAGLPMPTWLKPVIGTLSSRLVVRRLGRLAMPDQQRVRPALIQAIADRFLR